MTEVAIVLRTSRMTVYRLIKEGTIETTRIGRNFRLHADSVREYIQAGLQAP